MLGLAVAVLLVTAPVTGAASKLAGLYEIHQMEMGGGLELRANGRFRYALDYGAVSEEAEGNWEMSGNSILLTSNPKPNPPSFEVVSDHPAAGGKLYVNLEPPGFGSWKGRLRLLVTIAGMQDPLPMEAAEDGGLPLDGMVATAIQPIVPIYEIAAKPIALGPGGHRLVVRFRPNDLGTALFDREPITIDGNALIMRRYDVEIRFRRAP